MSDTPPRRALLSAYDKTGMVELGRALVDQGWELVSSGGTAKVLAEAGLPVIPTEAVTGFPEMLGHRVVTLHPAIHGGILADRGDPTHQADMVTHGITPIDLVAVNLYPFSSDPGIELIDIGGPAMVRAAAKNHQYVTVLVDPADYEPTLAEMSALGDGRPSLQTRRRLARDAFAHTAAYDQAIVAWFDASSGADLGGTLSGDTGQGLTGEGSAGEGSAGEGSAGEGSGDSGTGAHSGPRASTGGSVPGAAQSLGRHHEHAELPPTLELTATRAQVLRYGENPHQHGARYTFRGDSCWDRAVQHGGKEMSYLNVYDSDAAWRLLWSLGDRPAAVVIKHANPCGVAVADDVTAAYQRAHECDPVSAFGGIVAVNRNVTHAMAQALGPVFTEVLVAPGFDDDALLVLLEKRNLRVLSAPAPVLPPLDVRTIEGGLLVQSPDTVTISRDDWQVVTDRAPSESEWDDLELAWKVAARVTSNTIVLVKDGQAVGIGAGQQNRRDAGRIAAEKADGRAVGGACASDAFFPFRDGLDAAAEAGATAVIQPGGSIRDEEVIAAADEAGMAMVFTGERHFKH